MMKEMLVRESKQSRASYVQFLKTNSVKLKGSRRDVLNLGQMKDIKKMQTIPLVRLKSKVKVDLNNDVMYKLKN